MTEPGGQASRGGGVQALERGLCAIEILVATPGGLTVSELAERLAVSRPAVYRMLDTLELHRVVARRGDGRIRLAAALLDWARAVPESVTEMALPLLRQLAEVTGATAHLTFAEGGTDTCRAAAVVEPSHTDLHIAYRLGTRHRIDQGAAGKAILAARLRHTFPQVLAASARTIPGAGNPADAIREAGFVVTEGELQTGAMGVAAPVLGVDGLEASIGLVTLGSGLDIDWAGQQVVKAAAALAAALI